MDGELIHDPTLEDRQLEAKRQELLALEAQLAQRELDLATLQAQLDSFEHRYLQTVGMRQQELDRIEAQILECQAYLDSAAKFQPSASLKQLYRELAKQIHPDYATDPEERSRREDLMAEVNRAYAAGDLERLQTIYDDWQTRPEAIQGEDTAAELMRTIRRISQSQRRLMALESEIQALNRTDLFQLWTQAQAADHQGQNLLKTMAAQLEAQIEQAQSRLSELKQQLD